MFRTGRMRSKTIGEFLTSRLMNSNIDTARRCPKRIHHLMLSDPEKVGEQIEQ